MDRFFPAAEATSHQFKGELNVHYTVHVRKLEGGRLLLAMGAARTGDTTRQLVLIRASELQHFYPWLAEQLRRPN